MRYRSAVLLVVVAAMAATAGTAIAGSDTGPSSADGGFAVGAVPDPTRGLVYEGLVPGAPDGPCPGAFEVELGGGDVICTQGPDGAPAGVDVSVGHDLSDLAATPSAGPELQPIDAAACIGDGVSGPRVQAIYAVAADQEDRFSAAAPYIATWAANVDQVFSVSATESGGEALHVRWATNADCTLDIAHVVLSPSGDDTFGNMINEMLARGFARPDRKYLVWMDARVYCGIGQFQIDDRPGQDNRNNGAVPMFARTDAGCWGLSHSVEAHELTHVLGAVQRSAPHSTAHGHCWDEYDLMCYNDGSGTPMQAVCSTASARYLDCNFDDYFNPNPPAGSYLANHWNTADSQFLQAGPPDGSGAPPPEPVPPPEPPPPPAPVPPPEPTPPPGPDPAPANQAPEANAGPNVDGRVGEWISLNGEVGDDGLPSGQLAIRWTARSGPGVATFENDRAPATRVRFSAPGTYVLRLRAGDGRLADADRTTVTVSGPGNDVEGDMITDRFFGAIADDRTMDRVTVASSAGPAELVLFFAGTVRHERAPIMTLKVYHPDGRLLVTSRGRSPLRLSVDLPDGGLYTYVIRGPRGTAYAFEISHLPR